MLLGMVTISGAKGLMWVVTIGDWKLPEERNPVSFLHSSVPKAQSIGGAQKIVDK